MVGALGVVKDQPVGQFAVKERKVGKEQLLVVVDEGFLDCSVESFSVGVPLCVRISPLQHNVSSLMHRISHWIDHPFFATPLRLCRHLHRLALLQVELTLYYYQ
jgi:hypothetical protein